MPIAEARIETDRASRYLTQLCRHIDRMPARHGGPGAPEEGRPEADWSQTEGRITFGARGHCVLRAEPDALLVRLETAGLEDLDRLTRLLAARLGGFGRRDRLAIHWQRTEGRRDTCRRLISRPGTDPVAGAAIAESDWTGWATLTLVAVVGVKIVLMVGSAVLGRRIIRHRRAGAGRRA